MSTYSKSINKGSCLCGVIQFSIAACEPLSNALVGHCHCTMCQKFHGAAFSTFIEVKADNLQLNNGRDSLSTYIAENKTVRTFCNKCGSSLFFESSHNRKDKTIEVSLAVFDCLEKIKPDVHIYTESKAEWFEITDDLTQHTTYRTD